MTRLKRPGFLLVALAFSTGIGADAAVAGLLDDLKKKAQDAARQITPVIPPGAPKTTDPQGAGSDSPDGTGSGGLIFRAENGEPTLAARELAVVRFKPQLLNDEAWLRRIARNVEPRRRNWMDSDEFRWRREKDAIKAELLEQAKTAPTEFEITPWPGSKVMADLGQYDFSRKAFKMRVHGGASAAWPWGSDHQVHWLPVPPDVAEQMVETFDSGGRFVYAKYRLTIAGVEPKGTGQRAYPFFDDRIEKIDVYTLNGAPFPTAAKDFVYRVSLDTSQFRMVDHAGRR